MGWLRDIDRWFAESILIHAGLYHAYARRLVGDANEADDLVQDAYAQVLGLADWARIEAPERYVLRVIRNLAIERFRRAKIVSIRQIGPLEFQALSDPAPDAHAAAAAREELATVLAAIDRLPSQCRKVLVLRKMDGLTPPQIAARLNLSVSTVEKHLTKGLRLLTKTLAASHGRSIEGHQSEWRRRATKTEPP